MVSSDLSNGFVTLQTGQPDVVPYEIFSRTGYRRTDGCARFANRSKEGNFLYVTDGRQGRLLTCCGTILTLLDGSHRLARTTAVYRACCQRQQWNVGH